MDRHTDGQTDGQTYRQTDKEQTNLICRALVPTTLAFSYLVRYGVVVLWSGGTCLPSVVSAYK